MWPGIWRYTETTSGNISMSNKTSKARFGQGPRNIAMTVHDEDRDPLHAFADEQARIPDGPVPATAVSFTNVIPDHIGKDVDEFKLLNYFRTLIRLSISSTIRLCSFQNMK